MMRLKSDITTLCDAALDKRLDHVSAEWDKRVALGVVIAAAGYPSSYPKGDLISGLDNDTESSKVFHAGTQLDGDNVVTAGGRVVCVSALGTTVSEAQKNAYAHVKKVSWDGAFYRHDIGYRAVAREQN